MNGEQAKIGGRASRPGGEAEGAGGTSPGSSGDRGAGRGFGLPFDLENLRRGEWWLNKIGIALFLIGVVLLFKFSYEKGWLQDLVTPAMRVGLGLLAGTGLVGVGLRVYEARRAFAGVVLGGGIGAYYITGFAAFQMLGVFSYPVAFAFMAAVSALAFALAVRQDEAVLAVTGVSGGLATPFVLYDGAGAVGGLVLYASLVTAAAMGVYLYKGWRSLAIVASLGYWAAVFAGWAGAASGAGSVPTGDALVLQAGVAFGWVSLWLVPAAREVFRGANPTRWGLPEPGRAARHVFEGAEEVLWNGTVARVLSVLTPAVAFCATLAIWGGDGTVAGWAALAVAAGHALSWAGFRRAGEGGWISRVQGLVALPFATGALFLLVGGDALFVALAVQAAALHYFARRTPAGAASHLAHGLFLAVGFWLSVRLTRQALGGLLGYADPWGPLGVDGLANLAVVALVALSSGFVVPGKTVLVYRVAAHVGLLAWIWCEPSRLVGSAGDALVTVAWGAVGTGMFVAGLRRDHAYLIRGGLATLLLVVGKLLLWDLAWAEPIWRVLLFLGFGGLFLVLSYYLQNLWNGRTGQETPAVPGEPEELPAHRP